MTFLIKLYDDDKKVLKIYFQPHKLFEKVPWTLNGSDFNALSYFYLAYHWQRISRRVFRSIPDCIYVLEVIESPEKMSSRTSRDYCPSNSITIHMKIYQKHRCVIVSEIVNVESNCGLNQVKSLHNKRSIV